MVHLPHQRSGRVLRHRRSIGKKKWYGHTRVRVGVGVMVGVSVGVNVMVRVAVAVVVRVPVGVAVAVIVRVGVADAVGVGVVVTGIQSRKSTSTIPPLETTTAAVSGVVDTKPVGFSSTTMYKPGDKSGNSNEPSPAVNVL